MRHYVYLLINPSNDMKYIGKRSCSCLPEDDVKYMSSSKYVPKDECDKIVLKEFDTAKEAVAYEIELHNKFNVAINDEFYNRAKQTSTGWDTTGMPISKERREHQSKRLKGKKFTKEHCKKIGEANRRRKLSDETKAKISRANSGNIVSEYCKQRTREVHNKSIICTTTGKIFNSIQDACREYNVTNSNVSVVLNGKRPHTKGYNFEYYKESEVA